MEEEKEEGAHRARMQALALPRAVEPANPAAARFPSACATLSLFLATTPMTPSVCAGSKGKAARRGSSSRHRATAAEAPWHPDGAAQAARARCPGSPSRHRATAARRRRTAVAVPEKAGSVCPVRPTSRKSGVTTAEAARRKGQGVLALPHVFDRRARASTTRARRHGGMAYNGVAVWRVRCGVRAWLLYWRRSAPSPARGIRSPRHDSSGRHSEGRRSGTDVERKGKVSARAARARRRGVAPPPDTERQRQRRRGIPTARRKQQGQGVPALLPDTERQRPGGDERQLLFRRRRAPSAL